MSPKKKKRKKDEAGSLWLSYVSRAELELHIKLGGDNYRTCRPLIVISNTGYLREIIFLAKKGKFDVSIENCKKSKCKCKDGKFNWREKAKVYVYSRRKITFSLTYEQLIYIANFCGFCKEDEIEKIRKNILEYQFK